MFKPQLLLAASMAFAATTLNAGIIAHGPTVADGYVGIAPALAAMPGHVARGEGAVFTPGAPHCFACGQVARSAEHGFLDKAGPSLANIGARWDDGSLRGMMTDAKAVFPETTMPAFYGTTGLNRTGDGLDGRAIEGPVEPLLNAQGIEDVAAYLMTLTEC
jgi:L-cysteine S-thiosulfotransferase